MLTYKPIAVSFTRKGFRFNQLHREGDFAIFHRVDESGDKPRDAGFEVVVIARHDGYEIAGNKIEPSEVYPSNEQWGSMGWTYRDLCSAEIRFQSLLTGEHPVASDNTPVSTLEEADTDAVVPPVVSRRGRPRVEHPTIQLPDKEFSVKEVAETNKVQYVTVYQFVKEEVKNGRVKATREERRAARGPMTQLFEKVV